MSGLLYDAGALIAAERGSRRMWAIHKRALERGVLPVVPVGVIVEVWRGGHNANLARFLKGVESEPLTIESAKKAGELLVSSSSQHAIDATVSEAATRHCWPVVTGDRGDLQLLASEADARLSIIDI